MMKITHVLRGEEHLNNTPKQVLVYEALGQTPPRFGHMPLILGKDGAKMSKRDGATSVAAYREMGFLPEAMLNYLARLGWSHGNMELFSIDELRAVFSLDDIGKSPGKWDFDKLLWVNAHWMKTVPAEKVAALARPFFVAKGADPGDRDLVPTVLALRERSRTLVELAESGAFLFAPDDAIERDPAAAEQFLTATTLPQLASLADHLAALQDWSEAALEAHVAAWCESNGVKLGKIAQPIRVAVSGKKVGPGLFQTLAILGREVSLRRLRKALDAPVPTA
jgi:glutamyl-tRNA synthetase